MRKKRELQQSRRYRATSPVTTALLPTLMIGVRRDWLMRFRSLKRLTITSSSLMVMQSVQVKLRDISALWNRLSDIFALSRKRKQGA